MKRFVVTAIKAQLFSGVLQLSKAQADARTYALKALGDDLYLIGKPVEFKAGEEFGFDGEVSKALLQEMEPVEVNEAKKATKAAGKKADKGA